MKYLLALLAAVAAFAAHLGYAESSAWLQQGAQWLRQAETAAPAPSAAHFQARVTAVHDGDSVRATDRHGQRHKIRLAYIDAPELQQAHGMAARDALRRLIDGQQVEVAVLDTDQYGREVAQIRLHGRDINLAQIEEGHAWHYESIAKRRQDKADFAAYSRAEAGARSSRFGLWRAQSPQAPWAYRKAQSAEQVQCAAGRLKTLCRDKSRLSRRPDFAGKIRFIFQHKPYCY